MLENGWAVVALFGIVAWAVVAIASMFFKYQSKSREEQVEGLSLTTGELRTFIGEAVEQRIAPLQAKLERLERQLPERSTYDVESTSDQKQ